MRIQPSLPGAGFLASFFLLTICCHAEEMNERITQENAKIHAIRKLSDESGVAAKDIRVLASSAVTWPNSSLGCPQPDMMYTQVLTPGYRMRLEAEGHLYWVHIGGNTVMICKNPSDPPPEHALPDEQKL